MDIGCAPTTDNAHAGFLQVLLKICRPGQNKLPESQHLINECTKARALMLLIHAKNNILVAGLLQPKVSGI